MSPKSWSPRRRTSSVAAISLVLLGACLTDEDGAQPASIAKVDSTDAQTAPGGGRVALRAIVRSSDDEGVVRVAVRWSITSAPGAGGSLSDSVTLTDGTGTAAVRYTLGPAEGTSLVRAELADDLTKSVGFTVTTSSPPILATVTPARFQAGDQVVVVGSNLTDETTFSVGGVAAQAVSNLGTTVTLVIPPCLTPGTVALRAHAGTASSDPIFGDYTAPAGVISLEVGEYLSLSPVALQGCATFPAAGPGGAEYLIAPQSATGTPGDLVPYRLTGSASTGPAPKSRLRSRAPSHGQRFDMYLRDLERRIAQLPRPALPDAAAAAPAATVKLGQRRNFEVCASIPCAVEDFVTVRAEIKYVGSHAIIYEDVEAPEPGLAEEDFNQLGSVFDDDLYGVAARAFGAESDVDGDGHIAILLTPVVNSLTPKEVCAQSFIAGFFFAVDINPGSIGDPRSNHSEVFFAIAPDPEGEVTCSFSIQRILQQVPVTFVHEFQHMISFHQHAMLRGGSLEQLWLNEAMSHLAEELGGLHFRDLGDDSRFNQFAAGNLVNTYDYLSDPGAVFVLAASDGTGTLEERGAGWLFLRWLVDQFGDDLTRVLSESELAGASNVERATAEPLSRLLPEWFLANWVSDLPDSILADSLKPARLQYTTWRLRTAFAGFNEQSADRFPLPFPLVPELIQPPTFDRQGVLRAGSGDYYRVVQAAGDAGFTVALTDVNGAALSGAVPRFNVIRIR